MKPKSFYHKTGGKGNTELGVGVMTDEKLKLEDLKVSPTLDGGGQGKT